jgi:tight adherence protein C
VFFAHSFCQDSLFYFINDERGDINVITIYMLLFIVIVWAFSRLLERKTDRTYAFSEYFTKDRQNKSVVDRYLKPFVEITKTNLIYRKSSVEKLQTQLEQANMNITAEEFITRRILFTALAVSFFLTIFLFSQNKFALAIGLIAGLIMWVQPKRILEQRMRFAREMRKLELPDYATPLAILMESRTTYQAIKESGKFAGDYLKPFVEKLQVEMDMYPGSFKPLRNFAKGVDIPEAEIFVTALSQAMKTDPARSREIITDQVMLMNKLREESYNEMINRRPLMMNKYNALILLNMILIPLVALIINITNVIGGF